MTENIPLIKEWLLSRNASSTFNQCPHREIPLMRDDPPMEVYIDPNATPKAVHTPASIPIHWRDQVKEELDRDCKLVLPPVSFEKEDIPTL